ncbi:MAG: DUF2975 domain-containing protein [Caulobacter sp.]
MSKDDIARFRRLCGQYRWLAVGVVVIAGGVLATFTLIVPVLLGWLGPFRHLRAYVLPALVTNLPYVCYLWGVWAIGAAMGDIAKGRLIQPALASALRRVGVALTVGGVACVFISPGLARLVGNVPIRYLRVDVPSITLAMMGVALFLLGRVVDQANRVQSELDEML